MALQSSGQISLNDIRVELGLSQSDVSLGSMSDTAGFSAPDIVSDFYGYSASSTGTAFTTTARMSNTFTVCNASDSQTLYHDGDSSGGPQQNDYIYSDVNLTSIVTAGYYADGNGDWIRTNGFGRAYQTGFCF